MKTNTLKTVLLLTTATLCCAVTWADEAEGFADDPTPSAFENGTFLPLDRLPAELVVRRPKGEAVRFVLEERASAGYRWDVDAKCPACTVELERRSDSDRVRRGGNADRVSVLVTSLVPSPATVELRYVSSEDPEDQPSRVLRLTVVADAPQAVCAKAATKVPELADFAADTAFDSAPTAASDIVEAVTISASEQAVPPTVNERLAAECRRRGIEIAFHSEGRVDLANSPEISSPGKVDDPEAWMTAYLKRTMSLLGGDVAVAANLTCLPAALADDADRLWTDARLRQLAGKCAIKGIGIEIGAASSYPSPRFLVLAKRMGAKFTFGPSGAKDLSKWLEAIVWLDLKPQDLWTPACRK